MTDIWVPDNATSVKVPRPATRPPKMRRPPIFPSGPRLYRQTKSNVHLGGPGSPPAGFLTAQQTLSEWYVYWGSMKVLDTERDPREPPFWGGKDWSYQSQQLGQMGSHVKALSTNIDFLYTLSWPPLAVRVQTFRFHTAATSFKQAYDDAQLVRELGAFDVVDIYESDFLQDATGQAVIVLIKDFLGLIRHQDPRTAGTVYPVRSPIARNG